MVIKLQKYANDCGLVCLQAVHNFYFKKWIPLSTMRAKTNLEDKGVTALELQKSAHYWGLQLDLYKPQAEEIINMELKRPAIVLIKISDQVHHYVILEKIKAKWIYILDPVRGKKRISKDKFREIYLNLFIDISPDFIGNKANQKLDIPKYNLWQKNQVFIFMIIVTTLISSIMMLIVPMFSKVLFDSIIPGGKSRELLVLTFIFVFVVALKIISNYFVNIVKIRMKIKVNQDLLKIYFTKSFSIPLLELQKYPTSDRLKIYGSINTLVEFWTNMITTVSAIILIGIGGLIAIFWIDVQIALFSMLVIIIIFGCSFIHKKIVLEKVETSTRRHMRFNQILIELSSSSGEYKQDQARNWMNKRINKKYKSIVKSDLWISDLSITFAMVKNLILSLFPFLIYYLSTKKIFSNDLEIGSMIAVITVFTFLSGVVDNLSSILVGLNQYKVDKNIFDDFIKIRRETTNPRGYVVPTIKSFTFEKFSFSYSHHLPFLKIKNFTIDKNTHLIGGNGTGKSTLMKCMSGLYGSTGLKINNLDTELINKQNWRSRVAYIHPDIFLPSVPVVDWLTYQDKKASGQLKSCIKKYNLLTFLRGIGIDISQTMTQNGEEFSSGQKEIISLFQLFTRKYDVILLDEAFNHIDKTNLNFLTRAILDFQDHALFVVSSHANMVNIPIFEEVSVEEFSNFK